MNNAPTTAPFFHDCCLDDSCPGHEGWVTCESFPADATMVADIRDAAADYDRRARILDRFGIEAIADPELADLHRRFILDTDTDLI